MPLLGLGDDFQQMADDARRIEIGEVLELLMAEIAECADPKNEAGAHVPDVLVVIRCDQGTRWAHSGLTFERALYMLSVAHDKIIRESYSVEDE
jgi:hypothetical protein